MAEEEIDVRVRLKETAKFHSDSRRAAKDVDQITDAEKRSGKESEKASKSHQKLNKELNILHRVIGLVKPAALIAGLGLAAQGASALAAGAIALGSALAPLSGLLVAYPALGSAAAQGFGVVKLAMMGVGGAVGGLNAKMDPKKLAALSPPAQKFAKTLDSMKKPVLELQKSAQAGLFPGFTRALHTVRPLIGKFRDEFKLTGQAIGSVAERGAKMVASGPFSKDLQAQAKTNAKWIKQLGGAGLNLVDALRNVVRAGEPLVSWLVRVAVKLSGGIKHWAATARASGALAGFFEKTRQVATTLGKTAFSLARAFVNVGKAAFPLGMDLLKLFQRQAKAFADWTDSVKGKNALAEFFRKAKAPVFELWRLIRDVGKGFLSLGQGNQVAPLLRKLRLQLLPVLIDLVNTTTKDLGPAFIDFLVEASKLMATFVGSSGPLKIFVDLLTGAMKVLNWMLDNVPGLKPVFVTIVGAIGVIKALSFVAAIKQVTGLKAAFRRLGIVAGETAVAEQAAMSGGTPIPGRGGGLKGALGRAPSGGGLKSFAGVGAAAGPIGIAAIAKLAYDQTIGKLKGTLTNLIPEGVGRDLGGAVLDAVTFDLPGVAKHMVKAFQDVFDDTPIKAHVVTTAADLKKQFLRQGENAAVALALGLGRKKKLTDRFWEDSIFRRLESLTPEARRHAETMLVGFTRGMEDRKQLPEGTTKRLIRLLKGQFNDLPANATKAGKNAATGFNTGLALIIPGAQGIMGQLRLLLSRGIGAVMDNLAGKAQTFLNQFVGIIAASNTPQGMKALEMWAKIAGRTVGGLPGLPQPGGRPQHERPSGSASNPRPYGQAGGTFPMGGNILVGERGPEIVSLPARSHITPTLSEVQHPAGSSGARAPQVVVEAHHNIQIGSDTIYRHVTRHAAKVRRRKSGSSE